MEKPLLSSRLKLQLWQCFLTWNTNELLRFQCLLLILSICKVLFIQMHMLCFHFFMSCIAVLMQCYCHICYSLFSISNHNRLCIVNICRLFEKILWIRINSHLFKMCFVKIQNFQLFFFKTDTVWFMVFVKSVKTTQFGWHAQWEICFPTIKKKNAA